MRLTDFRWFVAACGEPSGVTIQTGHEGVYLLGPVRPHVSEGEAVVNPSLIALVVAPNDVPLIVDSRHTARHHPENMYLD